MRQLKKAESKYEMCNPATKWELVKCEIVAFTKMYSHQIAKSAKERMNSLIRAYNFLKKLLDENYSEIVNNELIRTQKTIESLQHRKTQTLLFMSKAKYHTEGERNTKYFYSLAKARAKNKTMYKLDDGEGGIVQNSTENS